MPDVEVAAAPAQPALQALVADTTRYFDALTTTTEFLNNARYFDAKPGDPKDLCALILADRAVAALDELTGLKATLESSPGLFEELSKPQIELVRDAGAALTSLVEAGFSARTDDAGIAAARGDLTQSYLALGL